jgi:hypothetical protein
MALGAASQIPPSNVHLAAATSITVKQLELNVIIQPVQERVLFLLICVDVITGIP